MGRIIMGVTVSLWLPSWQREQSSDKLAVRPRSWLYPGTADGCGYLRGEARCARQFTRDRHSWRAGLHASGNLRLPSSRPFGSPCGGSADCCRSRAKT